MSDEPLPIEQIMRLLVEMPPRFAALTDGLTSAQLHIRPSPDAWSVNELLAHLRSCADVWGGYIRKILAEDRPKIKALSPRTYIRKTNYLELECAPSFDAFTTQRGELMADLKALPPEAWLRAAEVTKSGKISDRTVQDFATQIASHEQVHLVQIEETAKVVRMM
jgi:hypothetical protein